MAPRSNKWDARNKRNMAAVQRAIDELFKELSREAALIASVVSVDGSKPFSFDDYPMTKQRVDRLLRDMRNGVQTVVLDGIDLGWKLGNDKNDALVDEYFGVNVSQLSPEQRRAYYTNNSEAQAAFKTRRENGLNLSDRVWRYSEQFKDEIEMGIDIGLGDGQDADELSRRLRSYLREPNKLFRRVRDKYGNLQLSKAAKAYHPGRGVYRSSYKNARRLAATETNIAYRTSDYDRYQQLDFVVGIRVELSNNHTLNGVPFYDICDELSAPLGSNATKGKGCYPKDFKFTGWHPLCRCTTFSILKTPDEVFADNARIMAGEQLNGNSVNRVEDVPQEFKKWVEDNRDRMARAKSLPYFLRDNGKYVTPVANVQKQAKFEELIKGLKAVGIARVPVRSLSGEATLDSIVKRVAGGDKTAGSCASLCLAFVGNRCGLSVRDFRGGQSQTTFSLRTTWDKINDAVGGVKEVGKNDFALSNKLLATMADGKEYIFITGSHAAVVRKTAGGYEYLELQSATDNGYKKLDNDVLKHRFSARKRTQYTSSTFLIELDKFKEISDLRAMLGYINTAASKQKKGKGGSAK